MAMIRPRGTGVSANKSGWKLLLSQWFCWSERRDLNSGPPVPQTGALTGLRYAPKLRPDYSNRPPEAQDTKPQHMRGRRAKSPAKGPLVHSPLGSAVKRIFSATLNSLHGIRYGLS